MPLSTLTHPMSVTLTTLHTGFTGLSPFRLVLVCTIYRVVFTSPEAYCRQGDTSSSRAAHITYIYERPTNKQKTPLMNHHWSRMWHWNILPFCGGVSHVRVRSYRAVAFAIASSLKLIYYNCSMYIGDGNNQRKFGVAIRITNSIGSLSRKIVTYFLLN